MPEEIDHGTSARICYIDEVSNPLNPIDVEKENVVMHSNGHHEPPPFQPEPDFGQSLKRGKHLTPTGGSYRDSHALHPNTARLHAILVSPAPCQEGWPARRCEKFAGFPCSQKKKTSHDFSKRSLLICVFWMLMGHSLSFFTIQMDRVF